MRESILWLLFTALFFGVSSPAIEVEAQSDDSGGEIVFASNRDGDMEIYRMDGDGRNVRQLTENGAVDDYPSWSPDGRYIAFLSNRDGAFSLYVMTAEDGNVRRIATYAIGSGAPSWSPNGQQIAFGSDRDGNKNIYRINSDGSNLVQMTDDETANYNPVWSPDGENIAFTTQREDDWEIDVLDIGGETRINASQNPDNWEFAPAWSPDGRLSFQSFRDDNGEIYAVSLDDLDAATNLTHRPDTNEWVHSWLPGGEALLFQSSPDQSENWEIYLLTIASGEILRLTDDPAYDGRAMWRPSRDEDLFNVLDHQTVEQSRVASSLVLGRQPLAIQAMLVEETFAEESSWPNETSENGSAERTGGGYQMQVTIPNGSWAEDAPSALVIEADINHASAGENTFSLMCRSGAEQGYFFDLHSAGLYSIRKYSEGEMTSIVPHKATPVIDRDTTARNHLMAVCVDDYLALYINQLLVAEAFDDTLSTGGIGFAVSTGETSEEAVAVLDNFRVWAVEPAGTAIAECWISVDGLVNIRIGPGTDYASVGQMTAGARLMANGQRTDDAGYIWWRFADHTWARSDVVNADEACERLPEVIR